jgi:acetyltransferase
MYALEKLTPTMLSRFTQIDYDREMALIAVTKVNGQPKQIGVARYVINPDGETCEFAIVVSDQWQRCGIARQLMLSLIETARRKGLKVMEGEVLRENQEMLRFMRKLGFEVHLSPDDYDIMLAAKTL